MVGRAPIFARCVWVVGETSDMSSSRGGAQFREKREGGGGEGEGEGVSPSNFLTRGSTCALRVASFERPIPRRWNLFFLSSYSLSSYWFSAQIENFESKFSSDWPRWIGQVKIKTKVNSCEKSLT